MDPHFSGCLLPPPVSQIQPLVLFSFGMQGSLRLRVYILEFDCLNSDVSLSLAVYDLRYKVVINSSTHHVELQDQMK